MVIAADNPSLEQCPEALNPVRVHIPVNVGFRVIDHPMRDNERQAGIEMVLIGIDCIAGSLPCVKYIIPLFFNYFFPRGIAPPTLTPYPSPPGQPLPTPLTMQYICAILNIGLYIYSLVVIDPKRVYNTKKRKRE